MRKISWLAILLIGGCTLIVEQSNLVSLNDSSEFRFWDEQVFIRSCRQLKEESYDIFYAAENQKCLEENAKQMQKLSEKIEQTNDLIKKEKLLDDVLASSEKFDACKISKGLTVAGFAEQSNDSAVAYWKRDKIIAYFTQVYQICENGEYFNKNDGNRIVADYQTVARQKEKNTPKIEKFKELKSEISSQNQMNKKIAALLSGDNPIIRKMQQAAPDFMRVYDDAPLAGAFDGKYAHISVNDRFLRTLCFVKQLNKDAYLSFNCVRKKYQKPCIKSYILSTEFNLEDYK